MNYYGDRYSNFDSAFSFPTVTDGTNGAWLGGNFIIESGAVPEPASWALMVIGFGALGVAMRSWRSPAYR
ncbi:PEPxxWA-CTERM sorting domain-containing protein [Sphingosinicellaceae bacterium]|nr:PEPxxWA-CTERM sorting domain-containing protein [Sphingosinicellaceae bacterium]